MSTTASSAAFPPPSEISEKLRDGLLINIGLSGALGLIFNLLLSWVLIKKVRKRGVHGDIILCTFVAITDVVVSITLIIRSIIAKYPYNLLKFHPNWCKFDVGFTSQLLLYSGYSLGVVSIERFLLICFNIKLNVGIWFGLIFLTWTSSFTLVMISLGQDLQILTKTEVQCGLNPVGVAYIVFSVALGCYFASFFIIIGSYCSITIIKFKQCLNQINLNIPKEQVYTEFRSTLAKSVINICFYLLVYFPKVYVALYEFSTGKKRTAVMDIFSNSTIVYSAVVNAIILLYMNQEVRNSFIQLLKDIKSIFIK
jgi:hypothetical protein